MSRINLSSLRPSSDLSRAEMGGTVGGARQRRVCTVVEQYLPIKTPFGTKLGVRRPVLVCRLVPIAQPSGD